MKLLYGVSLGAIILLAVNLENLERTRKSRYIDAEIQGKSYTLQLAQSKKEMLQGLQGVEFLEDNKGMMFVFKKEGFYNFHMHNVKMPLRMIWISEQGKIVQDIVAEPCKEQQWLCPIYTSTKPAKFVIEIKP